MRLLISFVFALTLACSGTAHEDTPTGAARLFVDAMERSADGHEGLEDAYRLLSQPTRERLVARARQAAALGAAEREPWEMLVEGTAHLRFTPRPGGFREEPVEGEPDHVIVRVLGPNGESAAIPTVHEDGGWRIDLVVPSDAPSTE